MKQSAVGGLRVLACMSALAFAGCPADNAASGGVDASTLPDAGVVSCTDDPLAEMYLPDMQKTGTHGVLKFALVQSEPGPPIKGNNTWTMKLTDLSGAPVTDATFKVKPFMPYHGHGTSVVPTVTPKGDSYEIGPLYLYMRGIWQVTLDAKTASKSDSAVFSFCVD